MSASSSITAIYKYLKGQFFERQDILRSIMVALVARQHMLLVGPPGCAKSALIEEFCKCITGAQYFEWLLGKYSTPDELFGPQLAKKYVEEGIVVRNTAGKMPEAHVVFITELFKGSTAILNSILTVINERKFHNNGNPVRVPLMSIFCDSNEYPDEDDGLSAVYDRFLLRHEVDYISEEGNFRSMLLCEPDTSKRPVMDLEELIYLQLAAADVSIGNEVIDATCRIRNELAAEGIRPSDRRWKQCMSLVKARATISGRSDAETGDLDILRNALWQTPDQRKVVSEIVRKNALDIVQQEIEKYLEEAAEIHKEAVTQQSATAGTEANKKYKDIKKSLNGMLSQYPAKQEAIHNAIRQIDDLNTDVNHICLAIVQ